MNKQSFCAMEVKPYGTNTGRLTSPIAAVIPVRFKRPKEKLLSDFFYKFQFDEGSEYTMLELDFASQEMLIAALLAQKVSDKPFGEDAFLKAMLSGTKEEGTDLYSVIASSINIKRNQAKNAVLATLYGCGIKTFTKSLLSSIDNVEERQRVKPLAKVAFETLKGAKPRGIGRFSGGVASNFFNWSLNNITKDVPVVPFFNQSFPKTLCPKYMGKSATHTAQINFPVQSGAAVLGILSIFLTLVSHQLNESGLIEKKDWRFGTSVHDSYTFLVKKDKAEQVAINILRAYLQTWAYCIKALNLYKLPHKLLFDCVVNESRCCRKSANALIEAPFSEWLEVGKQYRVNPLTGKLQIITNKDEMID